jgi:hypothetical protein
MEKEEGGEMECEISKESAEDIEACRRCGRVQEFRDLGRMVFVRCSALDRFDCPQILKIFYPKIYALSEKEREKLVERIREGRLTMEDAKYFEE